MAERDSKQALGMGSTTAAFVVDITGSITDMRQSLNLAVQEVRSLNQALTITKSLMGSLQFPSMGGGGGYSGSTTLVAANPRFTPPSTAPLALNAPGAGGAGGSNNGGGGGGGRDWTQVQRQYPESIPGPNFSGPTNLTSFLKDNPAAGALFASNIVSGALKSPADMVEAQLLMQRSAFFSGGQKSYNQVGDVVKKMAYGGMANDDMDTIRALAAAQSLGVTGPNVLQAGGAFGSVASGVSAVSNLLPGMGMEGSMRAFASMQQPQNVNKLRGLGIRLRDEQGNLKPPSQIIEDIWNKICRDYAGAYGAGKKPSEREVLIGLQPGNSMDSFLDQYFGNDPMAKQMIANGLLYKAKGGGNLNQLTPAEMAKMGGTTAASNAYFGRQAESTRGTVMYAAAGAKGYETAATELTKLSALMNTFMPTVIATLTGVNAYVLTMLGAGDNALSKLLGGVLSLGKLTGKASGGEVKDKVPYIVGEKGPELFVPKTDGDIVPNHEMSNYMARERDMFRHHGGSVKDSGPDMTRDQWATAFIKKLGGKPTAANMDAIKTWMAQEGGHWNNTAGYNPLNTKYREKGSVNMSKTNNVQHYTSWAQGLDASVKTLTGTDHTARGYDDIVSAIRNGSSKDAIIAAVKKSKWGTWNGSSGSSTSEDALSQLLGAEALGQIKGLQEALKNFGSAMGVATPDINSSLSALIGSGFGGAGSKSLTATGAGNKTVIINLNGAQETSKIMDQLKAELKKEGFLTKAGGS